MPRIRVHQHVNPLAPYFRFTPQPVEIEQVFVNPMLPLHLDIGSARGKFLLEMAEINKDTNFLGVEIREPLVIEANQIKNEGGLNNLHYEFINATYSLDIYLENIPPIETITIQFPDPWYKKKHAKRRMVDLRLAKTVADKLAENGRVFIQTDVEFLADEMFAIFRQVEGLQEVEVVENPFGVKTEREKAVEARQLPIYRKMFVKTYQTTSKL
jgi:tRNA (guanine-N7-)-methyltransferase